MGDPARFSNVKSVELFTEITSYRTTLRFRPYIHSKEKRDSSFNTFCYFLVVLLDSFAKDGFSQIFNTVYYTLTKSFIQYRNVLPFLSQFFILFLRAVVIYACSGPIFACSGHYFCVQWSDFLYY